MAACWAAESRSYGSDREGYGGAREPRTYMERPSAASYRDPYDGYGKMFYYCKCSCDVFTVQSCYYLQAGWSISVDRGKTNTHVMRSPGWELKSAS